MVVQWNDTHYVFNQRNGELMNLDTIGGYLKKFADKYNLKPVHLHSFRHSNASMLIASGVDLKTVSSRLSHSNLSTTGNIYAHVINTADAKASNALENILITPTNKVL